MRSFNIARLDGNIAGRIAIMVNNPYNEYHQAKKAQFYLFECVNNQEIANLLSKRHLNGAAKKDLMKLLGRKVLRHLTVMEYWLKVMNIVR